METIKFLTSLVLAFSLLGGVCSAEVLQTEERNDAKEQWVMDSVWGQMTEEQQYNADIKYKANAVRLSVEDFELFARVVEAESDGASWGDSLTTEGRIYVSACVWDRVYSSEFEDTVRGVLTESGQFTTVSGGRCRKSSTLASEWAIIKGRDAVLNGEIPNNMLFFNCISYFRGHTAFQKVGDNYFSTTGEATYFNKEDTTLDAEGTLIITKGGDDVG